MLNERDIPYRYRDYTKEPLQPLEIKRLLKKLNLKASQVFRSNDKANRKLNLTGQEPEDFLIQKMSQYPTLLQRPIGVMGKRALLGRPPEKLLDLLL